MQHTTPETLYADTVARRAAYDDLAADLAGRYLSYEAAHATLAADIQAVQVFLWERVMVAAPNPDEQFQTVAATVTTNLARTPVLAAMPPRQAVEAARSQIVAAFDPTVRSRLVEVFHDLDHLDGLPDLDPHAGAAIARARTGGLDVAEVIEQRRQAAQTTMSEAVALAAAGQADAALARAWASDWAALEAYLLDAARHVGDLSLITVELRWQLALMAAGHIQALPRELADATTVIRAVLTTSLGAVEGDRLMAYFAPAA